LKLRPARDTGKLVWGIWGRRPVNRSDLLRGPLRPWRPLAQGALSIKEVTPKFCGQRQRLEHEVSCKQQAPLLAVPRSPLGEGSRHLTPPTPTHPPHLAPTHLPSTSKPARPQPLIVRLSRTLFHKLRHRALLTPGAHYETQKQSRKPMPDRTTANRHLAARTGQIVPASSRPRSHGPPGSESFGHISPCPWVPRVGQWAGAFAEGLQTQSRYRILNAASLAPGGNTTRAMFNRLATASHRTVRLGPSTLLRPFVPRRAPSEQNDRKRETQSR
jgi:hypothetical protein